MRRTATFFRFVPRPLFPLAIFALPWIAAAQTTGAPLTFQDLADQIVTVLGTATGTLIVLGLVVYFWGIASSLFHHGETDYAKLRQYLIWGVVVIFVMVSIWGIVQILQTTLFGSDAGNATNGTVSSFQ